jgi:hypothetical protein
MVRSPYERRAGSIYGYQGEGWALRKPSAAKRAWLLDRREKQSEARTGSDFTSLG